MYKYVLFLVNGDTQIIQCSYDLLKEISLRDFGDSIIIDKLHGKWLFNLNNVVFIQKVDVTNIT